MGKLEDLGMFRAREEDTSRLVRINEHEYRSMFQRDRDRILYSKEFRRLSGKTQIFVTGSDDNIRTRLTHTLEVAQIAETMAARLKLDSMLTRAIALGHDIGHTPFGHVGERTLNHLMNGCYPYYNYGDNLCDEDKGFKHNLQGIRVACCLEQNPDEKQAGLNLTRYTLWGIMNHSKLTYKDCDYCKDHKECRYKNSEKMCSGKLSVSYYKSLPYVADDRKDWTFEGIIVAWADEIAQRHHDIEDGISAGIIDITNLCDYMSDIFSFDNNMVKKIKTIKEKVKKRKYGYQSIAIQMLSRLIVDSYVTDYVNNMLLVVGEIVDKCGIDVQKDSCSKDKIFQYIQNEQLTLLKAFGFSDDFKKADKKFEAYLSNHILYSNLAQSMDGKASYIIRQLVKAYLTNPQQLLDGTIISIIRDWCDQNSVVVDDDDLKHMTEASKARQKLKELINRGDPLINRIMLRRICDHIAGMTDQYAIASFERLYGSKEYEY